MRDSHVAMEKYGMTPVQMEGMHHDMAGNAVTAEAMFREMAQYQGTAYREYTTTTPTSDVPRTESSGTSEAWHGCSGLSEADKATHKLHGHCNPTD